jgi:lysophospholipase L1-like esterase
MVSPLLIPIALLQGLWVRATEWRALGFNGATSAEIHARTGRHVRGADLYLVSAGVNDVVRNVPPASFAANLRAILESLREASPQSTVIFAGIPPLESFPSRPWPLGALLGERARHLQSAAQALSGSVDMICCEFPARLAEDTFSRDGFHPAAAACDRWAVWLLEAWLSPAPREASAPGRAAASPRASRS